ncbi:helix-turn-helix domain-containing protein [Nonomuraea sp. NPDC005983]
MQLRFSLLIDLTPAQRFALARPFGCARALFDDALRPPAC